MGVDQGNLQEVMDVEIYGTYIFTSRNYCGQ